MPGEARVIEGLGPERTQTSIQFKNIESFMLGMNVPALQNIAFSKFKSIKFSNL